MLVLLKGQLIVHPEPLQQACAPHSGIFKRAGAGEGGRGEGSWLGGSGWGVQQGKAASLTLTHLVPVEGPLGASNCLASSRAHIHHALGLLRVLGAVERFATTRAEKRPSPTRFFRTPSRGSIVSRFLLAKNQRWDCHFLVSQTTKLKVAGKPTEKQNCCVAWSLVLIES